jgi:EAL domain-containing protein (putative c-di-GMP-specific phosphodiesterase class I)
MRTLYTRTPRSVRRLSDLLLGGQLRVAFQPIVSLGEHTLIGMEALLRIEGRDGRWSLPGPAFHRAAAIGWTLDLEVAALALALTRVGDLPHDAFLAVNASPSTMLSPRFAELVSAVDLRRVVVEITENEAIEEYDPITDVLGPLREGGMRVAIDDTGAGASTFRHILRLRPDVVKLDISLVDEVCTNDFQQALVRALVRFTAELGVTLIAEGIEDPEQAEVLRDLGVLLGQGFILGRPAVLATRS